VRSSRRRLAGAWRCCLRIDLGCTTTSGKGRGDRAVAHLGSDEPARRRRTATDNDERRRTDGVGEETRRRAAHSFRLHGPARGGPVKLAEGSARPKMHRWPAIARRRLTGCDGSGSKSGERKGGGREQGPGGRPCIWGGASAVVPGGGDAVD
jgi:hypothetical protein